MKLHQSQPMWEYGTQPLLLLVSFGRWLQLPTRWNLDGLGYKTGIEKEVLRNAAVLHWSGKRKPWLEGGSCARGMLLGVADSILTPRRASSRRRSVPRLVAKVCCAAMSWSWHVHGAWSLPLQ